MACDLPATTMTLLTCYLSYQLITMANSNTQTNTHVETHFWYVTTVLAGVPPVKIIFLLSAHVTSPTLVT